MTAGQNYLEKNICANISICNYNSNVNQLYTFSCCINIVKVADDQVEEEEGVKGVGAATETEIKAELGFKEKRPSLTVVMRKMMKVVSILPITCNSFS